MNILYILPFIPWEIKVRSFNLIPRLARRHEIHLVCVSSTQPTARQKEWLNAYCQSVTHVRHSKVKGTMQCGLALLTKTPLRMAYAKSKPAQSAVRRISEQVRPDVVYVERWRAQQFIPGGIQIPIVSDPTDSMTLYNRRLMSVGVWWEKLLGWEEYAKFVRYEGGLARQANVVIFCSQLDRDEVKQQAPEVSYELVGNGVDCEKYFFKEPSEEEPERIVFTGSLKYRPNRHAVEYFLKQIFPIVRKAIPAAKFLVVGNGASAALASYRSVPNFAVVDFVPDLRPYLAKAAIAVAPLTVGAGVSNKLGEGFAVGTPVVATPIACGDLPVRDGYELLIGCNAQEFAKKVTVLLNNSRMRRQIALSARAFIENYDWEVVSATMEQILDPVK
jgi:glycosyltransferase involved in cell wall biosynthesis